MPNSDHSAHVLNNLPDPLSHKRQPSYKASTGQHLAKHSASFVTLSLFLSWLAGFGLSTACGRLRAESEALARLNVLICGRNNIDGGVGLCVAHVLSLVLDSAYRAMAGTPAETFTGLDCSVHLGLLVGAALLSKHNCNQIKTRLARVCTYISRADCIVMISLVVDFCDGIC
jgi:hypothetical protein